MFNITEILNKHLLWLQNRVGGMHADLRGANLRDANLRGVNLRGADLEGADLEGADLRGANLRDANLRDANLRDADLRGADLRDANLRDANLRDANLRGADLRDANLRDANLRDANLRYCVGNGREIKSLQIGTYLISYHKATLNIGCQSHTLSTWESFSDKEVATMDTTALTWWQLNKEIIISLVRSN
jgi:uncharacterized protein YjbI with pentapeptide repeats